MRFAERVARAGARLRQAEPLVRLMSRDAFGRVQADLDRRLMVCAQFALHEQAVVQAALQGRLPWMQTGGVNDMFAPEPEVVVAGLPDLAPLIDMVEADWSRGASVLLRALADDAAALQVDLTDGVIRDIDPAMSDPHHGGRMTAVLALSDGRILVYKPRPLDMEAQFARLVRWLSDAGIGPRIDAAPVLVRGEDHGWMGFIAHDPCRTQAEMEGYWKKAGGLYCLLTILQATDIHRENIVASGGCPVLVDAETLFQPRPRAMGASGPQALLRDTMMLPPFGADTASDFSAFCSRAGDATAIRVAGPEGNATPYRLPACQNLPHLGGRFHGAEDYPDALTDGFAWMFRDLVQHRDALSADGGPLRAFATARGRYVARGTQSYGAMLRASLSPAVLGQAGGRRAMLRDQLRETRTDRSPATFEAQELNALARMDVPRLTCRPGDPGPEGHWRAPLQEVCDRLAMLSVDDLPHWLAGMPPLTTAPRRVG
ncbi:MAG: type 2 lanthipeptide synthetase LanM [Pseudomonadota bacterium]